MFLDTNEGKEQRSCSSIDPISNASTRVDVNYLRQKHYFWELPGFNNILLR